MKSSIRRTAKAILPILLLAMSAPALAQNDSERFYDPLQDRISSARTAADHEALAREYTRLEALTQADAKLHERRGSAYGDSVMEGVMQKHCKAIAELYRRQAKEFAALADGHHTLARLARERPE